MMKNTMQVLNHYIKVGKAVRVGKEPCVTFHIQKIPGCDLIYLGTYYCFDDGYWKIISSPCQLAT